MSWSIKTGTLSYKKSVLLMAHRGGEGLWPSNTLFAFQKALEVQSDVLEMDIHITADGVLVIRHDPSVDSTTDGSGLIGEYKLAQLKKLDAGYTWTNDGGKTFPFRGMGITIPTLEEVFQAFPDTPLNIDIKDPSAGSTRLFCKMLNDYDRQASVVVGSFHDAQLNLFRRLCPNTRTAAGVRETRTLYLLNLIHLGRLYKPPAFALQIPEVVGRLRLATPRFLQAAHNHGIQVHVWTVNEVQDMLRLIRWGVDGIITDYPDRLAEILSRQTG